jgi:hypothetical protein
MWDEIILGEGSRRKEMTMLGSEVLRKNVKREG